MLESSISPLFNYTQSHNGLQSQSMFLHPMGAAEQQALVQAFVQANVGCMMDQPSQSGCGNLDSLLKSSNSSSMVDSSAS